MIIGMMAILKFCSFPWWLIWLLPFILGLFLGWLIWASKKNEDNNEVALSDNQATVKEIEELKYQLNVKDRLLIEAEQNLTKVKNELRRQ